MTPKRILINTNHFYPEVFRVNDVAFHLAQRGHKVTVITCIPNYPEGKTFPGYGLFKRQREVVNGVDVIRVPVIPRGDGGSATMLFLNYLSYLISATLRVLLLVFQKRFDCILVHETSPVTVGVPAAIVKILQRIPMYFWVLDLWPESLSAAGGINNKAILGLFNSLTRWLYKKSTKILISSKGFRSSICKKGDFDDKIIYFPNWGEDALTEVKSPPADFKLPDLPKGFRIMYAGNIGEAQNFEDIMQAALLLKDSDVRWLLVGDGRKREWVEKFVADNALSDSVFLLGRHPIETMPMFFAEADILFVSLKNEYIFNNTVPAKLQAYMAFGKPILAMINGEGAEIVKDANCGFSVPAGDYKALSETIKDKVIGNAQLSALGKNGRNYYYKNYSKDIVLSRLNNMIEEE